jgi:hypothetical protein
MKVFGAPEGCYLYLHGVAVPSSINLAEGVELLPAGRPKLSPSLVDDMERDEDRAVLLLFLPRVASQLRITGENAQEVATRAWNGVWDGMLVGALAGCEVTCNLQSSVPVEELTESSNVHVTNHHLRGLQSWPPVTLKEEQCEWLKTHFSSARSLMDKDSYRDAVHAFSSYKWHSLPRAQLAMIWSGIEGLFGIDSEITFKLSLGIAKFLGESVEEQRQIFQDTKTLYRARSKAVHGGKIKGDVQNSITESAVLLKRLILRTSERGRIPDIEQLII